MVKLILMPKFEHQMARRIAHSEVCKSIIPRKALVRVAICQDGREPITQSDLTAEISYFKMLYYRYLYWQDVQLEFYSFSFLESSAELLQQLRITDIFFMTGFTPGTSISSSLTHVFQNHHRCGVDESLPSNGMEDLFRCIKSRVQYNDMLYMGTCGGACCAGNSLWSRSQSGSLAPPTAPSRMELFDFCMGVSLEYSANTSPTESDMSVINSSTFMITSGAALAVHIEKEILRVESFPAGKNNTWRNYPTHRMGI